MMRSLYAGVSGLRSHQTRMDVIGNNIANVNTIGFKGSRVTFRDVLYQTVGTATMPTHDPLRGGTNPTQIGTGTMVSHIDMLFTRAGPMTTDRPMDIYIDGEGFIAVFNPGTNNVYFTRVGDLRFDTRGNLLDGNGNFVLGLNLNAGGAGAPLPTTSDGIMELNAREDFPDPDTPGMLSPGGFFADDWNDWLSTALDWEDDMNALVNIDFGATDDEPGLFSSRRLTQLAIGPDGLITGFGPDPDEPEGEPIQLILGRIYMFNLPNVEGMQQVGNTYLMTTANSGFPAVVIPGTNGTGRTFTSRLEMSNVELAREFTDMIVTQRGFQANSRIITVSDEMLQELVNLRR